MSTIVERRKWSCDERGEDCRNPHGCHCREISTLSQEVERLTRERDAALSTAEMASTSGGFWAKRAEAAEAEAARLTAELTAAEQRVEHYKREGQGRLASIAIATAERDAALERVKVLEEVSGLACKTLWPTALSHKEG